MGRIGMTGTKEGCATGDSVYHSLQPSFQTFVFGSGGDLVTRLVREAVTRHDPRGSGSGHRRRREDSASASPRRAPNKTRATGTAAGPAQRVDESSPRAPEPDPCHRGAGGPASARRRRYSGAAG